MACKYGEGGRDGAQFEAVHSASTSGNSDSVGLKCGRRGYRGAESSGKGDRKLCWTVRADH